MNDDRKPWKPGRVFAPSVTLLAMFGWVGLAGAQPPGEGGPPPAKVRLGVVERSQVQQQRRVTGQVEPAREAELAAEEEGRVVQAPPDAGSAVRQGQMLLKLDDTLLAAERDAAAAALTEAEAIIAQREAELELATKQRKRYEQLVPTNSASQNELDQSIRDQKVAQATIATAKALVAQRRAALKLLEERLANMIVAAPFDGYLIAKSAEVGEWLGVGAPVATLVAIDPVDVVLDVPESMVGQLREDQAATVRLDATGRELEGKVHRIVPSADRRARTFPVMIRVANPEGLLKPGMSASASLPTGDRIEALTVPRDAVQITPQGAQVFASRGGAAAPVPVRIDFVVGDRMVVQAELNAGDQVVIEGNERLMPGQPLAPMEPSPEAAAPPDGQNAG